DYKLKFYKHKDHSKRRSQVLKGQALKHSSSEDIEVLKTSSSEDLVY
ncbi:hypothetical protein A2U01_0075846, partial [Trifolium medium]|nr:hypothetical protein [Trifolium medium]